MSVESAPPPLFDNRPSVVFADDDPVIRSYLCLQLLQSFDLAGVARNASEAIAVVAERQPDLVILDVHMPGGGGWHATREIRRRSPRTAIVVLSADEARTEVNELLRLGAVTYMRKGIEPQALMDTLNFALEAHHNGLAAAAAAQPHSPHPVLVAEDDPINEFAVTEILRRLGYRVDVARNGLEAVEMAAARDARRCSWTASSTAAALTRPRRSGGRGIDSTHTDHDDDRSRRARRPAALLCGRDGQLRLQAAAPRRRRASMRRPARAVAAGLSGRTARPRRCLIRRRCSRSPRANRPAS